MNHVACSDSATAPLQPRSAPAAVEVRATDGVSLLVPVVDVAGEGAADLGSAVVLNPSAQALWRALADGGDVLALIRTLVTGHGRTETVARLEVSTFLRDLRARGVRVSDGVHASDTVLPALVPNGADDVDPAVELTPGQVVQLARAVLGGGQRLRFRARGFSMRPQIPHGAVIEVSPRLSALRRGDVVLYVAGDEQLVAHRVLRLDGNQLVARGDSAARVDRVACAQVLGVVTSRLQRTAAGWVRIRLDTWTRRALGRLTSAWHRGGRGALRWLLVKPLRASPRLRHGALFVVRLHSRLLSACERRASRWRRRLDVAIAVLMPAAKKDASRRALYARPSVQDFTALDENVQAGFTLIEEVMLARHPLPPGEVLVLGCGPGRECVALARLGHRVTGLDREPNMLAAARGLADRTGVALDLLPGDAVAFHLGVRRFAAVVAFSGLYNMVLPRARRVAMLRCALAHLTPQGKIYLTFLSDYAPPTALPPPRSKGLGQAIDDQYEEGDLWLRNEAVHIVPHRARLIAEAGEAGLRVVTLFRDQRAYDKETRQVRGFVILERKP